MKASTMNGYGEVSGTGFIPDHPKAKRPDVRTEIRRRGTLIFVGMWVVLLMVILLTGCGVFTAAVNTTDVTKVTVTTTGLRIGKAETSMTPELTIARHQVEYYKIPTGLASTNSKSASDVQLVPSVTGSYEAGAKSALFGNATVTTTIGVGDPGVATIIGGQHVPINTGAATASAANSKLYSSPITFGGTAPAAPNKADTSQVPAAPGPGQ